MSQQLIDAFIAAVTARHGRLETAELHDLTRAAKLVRLDVEAGTLMSDKRWEVLFPDEIARGIARQTLTEKPAITEMDFDKTAIGLRPAELTALAANLPAWARPQATSAMTNPPAASAKPSPAAAPPRRALPPPDPMDSTLVTRMTPGEISNAWHSLLTAIPPEGLLSNDDPGKRLDFLELGRMVLDVSQGRGPVLHARIPEASGFRARFVQLARAAGRTALVTGLPDH